MSAGTVPLLSGDFDSETSRIQGQEFVPDALLEKLNDTWPVLTVYENDYLNRIALPLGGIGTGVVSLGGRGDLRDWEIVNRPAKGFTPENAFFTLYSRTQNGASITRVLEGPIPLEMYEGGFGARARNHGLPRFEKARFAAAYPFGQVILEDPDVPLLVRIEAFNPFIPADAEASGLPVAVMRFVLENKTDDEVVASVCGSINNFIGTDGSGGKSIRNVNQYKEGNGVRGLLFLSEGVTPGAEQWGTIALTTLSDGEVSHLTSWVETQPWRTHLTDFWDDFSVDGRLSNLDTKPVDDDPVGSVAIRVYVPARGTQTVTFLLTWHFPNRQTWTPDQNAESTECSDPTGSCCRTQPNCIGNYYTTKFRDAWEAAETIAPVLPDLERRTLTFIQAFCAADLPPVVKEAALYNLSTLRSQTTFRTPDGYFFGFEGCADNGGCCFGSCTHVWNYEQSTAFLFGDLARRMREIEFDYATDDEGLMSFRVSLPLEKAKNFGKAAADGQMGTIMKMYRDWQLSGDDTFLRRHWPRVKKALVFAWIPGGWDADRDGIMEGAQHNTMDVEYYGPNAQMQFWYLGALRAAEEMARYLGDSAFADTCRSMFEKGSHFADEHLFNGEYYIHDVRPPMEADKIAPSLLVGMGATDLVNPDFQLGKACLVDQLVGQYMAHVCRLGYLADHAHIKTTLRSILKYNFVSDLSDHFNNMRTFALGKEGGILMASYPLGDRPERPFPYYNELMTGFEYTAGIHMLFEGMKDDGITVIRAIRDRYDGRKRNPFNEAECGHHYARAMAAWAAVLALTGFDYSAVNQELTFSSVSEPTKWFWSNGYAWGTCSQNPEVNSTTVELTVHHGSLQLRKLNLQDYGTTDLTPQMTVTSGQTARFIVPRQV